MSKNSVIVLFIACCLYMLLTVQCRYPFSAKNTKQPLFVCQINLDNISLSSYKHIQPEVGKKQLVFVPGLTFQPILIFVSKARA